MVTSAEATSTGGFSRQILPKLGISIWFWRKLPRYIYTDVNEATEVCVICRSIFSNFEFWLNWTVVVGGGGVVVLLLLLLLLLFLWLREATCFLMFFYYNLVVPIQCWKARTLNCREPEELRRCKACGEKLARKMVNEVLQMSCSCGMGMDVFPILWFHLFLAATKQNSHSRLSLIGRGVWKWFCLVSHSDFQVKRLADQFSSLADGFHDCKCHLILDWMLLYLSLLLGRRATRNFIVLHWIESYPPITSAVFLVFIHFCHTWTLGFSLKDESWTYLSNPKTIISNPLYPTLPNFRNHCLDGGFHTCLFSQRKLGVHDPSWLAHMFRMGGGEIHQLILMLYAVINSISPVDDGKSRVIYRVSYMSGFLTTDFVMFFVSMNNGS